jgi:hypothetical protein
MHYYTNIPHRLASGIIFSTDRSAAILLNLEVLKFVQQMIRRSMINKRLPGMTPYRDIIRCLAYHKTKNPTSM